jgi:hypothetical protein|tara:strand:+ start:51 stop:242 length:192 start_codon:yes stop_codon:yes gene_type:complete
MASNNSNDAKWFAIMAVGIFSALSLWGIFDTFAPDPTSERIAACMSQSGMQYVPHGCIPAQSN